MVAVRVARYPDGSGPEPAARPIGPEGMTIGRAPDCDLVLDDALRLVSRRHAWIVGDGEAALLRCVSASATLLVNGETLEPRSERAVRSGDRIRIGGFEIVIEDADDDVAPAAPVPQRAAAEAPAAAPAALQVPVARRRLDRWFDLDTVADPLGPGSPLPPLVDPVGEPARRQVGGQRPGPLVRNPTPAPLSEGSTSAAPQQAPVAPPVDFEIVVEDAHAAEASNTHAPSPPVEADAEIDTAESLRRAFLRGARLDPASAIAIDPRWMQHVGALLRTSTEGTLGLLRSRALAKRGLGAEGTAIVARENNPLKFAPDGAEALKLLLEPQGRPGFLEPVEALREAHADLQVHQLAMIAGMRAAVFDLISRLGGDAIEQAEGPPSMLFKRFSLFHDAALWRRYGEAHARLVANLDDTFESVFGREFLRAYEAQSASSPARGSADAQPERPGFDASP